MKKEYVRQVVVFEDHFKDFRKTLDRDTLKKLYQVLTLILFNGFQKKTQKTPVEQLDKAEALMKKYFDQKNEQNNG